MNDFHRFELEGWNRVSISYHDSFGRLTEQLVPVLLQSINAKAGQCLLDVACGGGALVRQAREQGIDAWGADFSYSMLSAASRRTGLNYFVAANAQQLPFQDQSFHALTCNFGILHFPDALRFIGEAHRVLKPSGTLAFTAWCPPQQSLFFQLINDALELHADPAVALPPGPPMHQWAERDYVSEQLQYAGFGEIHLAEFQAQVRAASAEQIIQPIMQGSVRAHGLIAAQNVTIQEKIWQAIVEGSRRYQGDDGVSIPMAALVVVAKKM